MTVKKYYIYLMVNKGDTTIYTGMTGNLQERVRQHKEGVFKGFTSRYRLNKLVYYEEFNNAYDAITREKQIKGGSRKKKIELIEGSNCGWEDLSDGWYNDK
ncbi:MAG: GIY-YIG nuclease family protein [Candidatus Buchananbacteria bacterium]|nr:GIY-YIG nuclease family protein [Candidatus Buchananbacteria bacterium]